MDEILRSSSAVDDQNPARDAVEPNSTSLFREGEKVLATHLFSREKFVIFGYRIAYSSFKYVAIRFDEWVGINRLMKYTEENISKKQAFDPEAGVYKNTRSRAKSKSSPDTKVDKVECTSNVEGTSNVDKGEQRKTDPVIEENPSEGKLATIQIPLILKKQLVFDWEFINQQNKLVKLPRSPSVNDILTQYLEYLTENNDMKKDAIGVILNGIRCYFDRALPVVLLYNNERQQYLDAISDNVSPSSIYGAEHLLRLFVKLPQLLTCQKFVEETCVLLQQRLLEFLKFMQDNEGTFFDSAYDDGPKITKRGGKRKELA
ncbi:hypothetical protein ACJIZ3_008029 [Penstemon smallii]|uniref:MRG domain-containing protein n=1 Tax=Penstemon smallii TaxID=265156 RepID=A0ABD3TA38_9LAMI